MTSEFCYLSVSHSGYAQVSATMYNLSLLPLNVITWLCSCIIFYFGIIIGNGMEFLLICPVIGRGCLCQPDIRVTGDMTSLMQIPTGHLCL